MARLLGIDAGFAAVGVVVVDVTEPSVRQVLFAETCRTKRTAKKRGIRVADDDAERCQEVARFLIDAIRTHQPAGAVVELPSGGAQGARANRSMGMATGIVTSVLEAAELPSEWVTPQMVKKAATGRNDGSKADVQKAVRRIFEWDNHWPKYKWAQEHVADAAAAVLAAEGGTLIRTLDRVAEVQAKAEGA